MKWFNIKNLKNLKQNQSHNKLKNLKCKYKSKIKFNFDILQI